MKQLEELEYPKPNRELVYDTFNAFAKRHPWVSENIRPKSIAREMSETMQTFSGYVKDYGLQRSEGVLLRYLSEVYKVMVQTVPQPMKNDAVEDLIAFLGAIVRGVDASLLEEWERLRDPTRAPAPTAEETVDTSDVTRDVRGFTVLVRNMMFKLIAAFARRDVRTILDLVLQEDWTEEKLRALLEPYYADHTQIRVDAAARAPSHLKIESKEGRWELRQTLLDEAGDDDWLLEVDVDLALSREQGEPVLRLKRLGR
jgi:hypothetical protein